MKGLQVKERERAQVDVLERMRMPSAPLPVRVIPAQSVVPVAVFAPAVYAEELTRMRRQEKEAEKRRKQALRQMMRRREPAQSGD